jgi:hydroxymethylbilane synthase
MIVLACPHSFSVNKLRLGTRGSVLARWQANWTAEQLQSLGVAIEIVVIQTSGDLVQNESIVNIGAQGVFTKEIQRALLEHTIDIAVHSLKDLPTDDVAGLSLAAVPKRESYRDAFVSLIADRIEDLPKGSRIGTGSLRRKTQVLYHFGDRYRVEDIRGNVETRLRKLEQGEYDALILAEAGLIRLGRADCIRSLLEPPLFLPAIGQGALGWEIRTEDRQTADCLLPLNDVSAFAAVRAERAMLRALRGGCSAPIAALGSVKDAVLSLHGRILSPDGKRMFDVQQSVPLQSDSPQSTLLSDEPEHLGTSVARQLETAAGVPEQ